MSTETVEARVLVEVQWGVLPVRPMATNDGATTREQVEEAKSWKDLLAPAYEEFDRRMSPAHHNWVTMTWLWL